MSRVKHQAEQKGMSFKLSYAKTFDEYNSAITFAGYRFSQRNFRTFSQFLDEQYENNNSAGNEKEMYTITGNKTFFADDPLLATTLYLTYTHQNYWDRGSRDRYGLSMGHSFSFAGIRGSAPTLRLTALSIRANETTVFRFQSRCHGAMAALWITNCRTAATRPARWFRIPITATVTIRGVCAQGFR